MKKLLLVDEKGSAAVEFALVLPILLIIIFGTIEFGLLMYNKQIITNASREGARAGIVFQESRVSDGDIIKVVQKYTEGRLVTFGDNEIALEDPVVEHLHGQDPGDDLTVTVTYHYTFLIISAFIPLIENPLDLTARTVMKYE